MENDFVNLVHVHNPIAVHGFDHLWQGKGFEHEPSLVIFRWPNSHIVEISEIENLLQSRIIFDTEIFCYEGSATLVFYTRFVESSIPLMFIKHSTTRAK